MIMDSGKRLKIVISCVTFETIKISDAVEYYDPDRVYLVHYVREDLERKTNIYKEFYDETVRKICESTNIQPNEIIEIVRDVNEYSGMLQIIHEIIEKENKRSILPDIYVNISAGSSDYVAAASMVSMMYENVVPFTVKTRKYTISEERLRECYYSDEGKPIGMAESVFNPTAIPKIKVPRPERSLVLSLRVVSDIIRENNRARASKMIFELKKQGLWLRKFDANDMNEKTCPRNDLTYFHRDFMDKWIEKKWMVKDEFQNTYRLTEEGKRILGIFYREDN